MTAPVPTRPDAVTSIVPARVGLVGNPSDGYGGAVLGTIVPSLAATVTATPSSSVTFICHASNEAVPAEAMPTEVWPTLDAWQTATDTGHRGPQRIISAALAALVGHVGPPSGDAGIELAWSTTIPRSVGLAGSSALAVGVIDAAASVWGHDLDLRVTAALALAAERDLLGIAAGWQDRIIQASGTTVLVDAGAMTTVDGHSVPAVSPLPRTTLDPAELIIGWRPAAASGSDGYHGALRDAAHADVSARRTLLAAMGDLALLARQAHAALGAGDIESVATLVDAAWLRRQSVAPLRADHAALVEQVRACGVAATTPGSGGAVVAVCRDTVDAQRVIAELDRWQIPWRRQPVTGVSV